MKEAIDAVNKGFVGMVFLFVAIPLLLCVSVVCVPVLFWQGGWPNVWREVKDLPKDLWEFKSMSC